MKEKINTPYSFTKDEKETIKDNFTSHNDWDKSTFNSIKDNLVTFLRNEQDNECCYCKRELGFDIKEVDIEHILPKSRYEKFTFHPKNLALSCPGCNTKKSTNEVLKKTSITNYPRNGSNVKIVHAHYDNYSKHIEILDTCVYTAHDDKGHETIGIAKLYRLKKVEENARKANSGKSIMSKLVEELRNSKPEEMQELLDLIKSGIN